MRVAAVALACLLLGCPNESPPVAPSAPPAEAPDVSPREQCTAAYKSLDTSVEDLVETGRIEEAAKSTLVALAQCERDLGPDEIETARMRRLHAHVERVAGHYDVAKVEALHALHAFEHEYDITNRDVSKALDVLAACALLTADYEHAIELSDRIVKIRERWKDGEPSEVASPWIRIGSCHTRLGHRAQAIEAMTKALEIVTAGYPAESKQVANARLALGETHRFFRNLDDAEREITKAVEILQKTSPDSDLLASATNDLGALYHYGRKDLDRAEPLYRNALATHMKIAPDSASSAQVSVNLGTLLCEKGHMEEGRPLYDRGLARMRAIAGKETPDIKRATAYFDEHVK